MTSDHRSASNPERGCGYLKEGKAYLRGVMSPSGTLPPFVTFDEPIPFLEGQLRGYAHFPGVQFELTVAPDPSHYASSGNPPGKALDPNAARDHRDKLDELRDGDGPSAGGWRTPTDPPLEIHRHLERLGIDADMGESGKGHVGQMRTARAHDLLMWVGETYYPDPSDFIDECRRHGLSKAIPVGKNQEPPVINPGRSRVFLVHPTAVYAGDDEDGEPKRVPGIIGYAYVTEVIYTGTEVGGEIEFPEWAEAHAEAGRMDLVEVGERVPEATDAHDGGLEQWAGDDESTDSADATPPEADGEGDTPSADEDGADDDVSAEAERLMDDVGYNEARSIASEFDLGMGSNPTHEELAEAILDAGLVIGADGEVTRA